MNLGLQDLLAGYDLSMGGHRTPTHIHLAVEKRFPGDRDRLARMSLIEGSYSLLFFRSRL